MTNPCRPMVMRSLARESAPCADGARRGDAARAKTLGVTIEAEYTVGEYDILILSAERATGCRSGSTRTAIRTPEKARRVLSSYIKQGMKFFVARVNLEEKAKLGGEFLRPLQIAFESEKFMLPIRLGTVNARGKQDLLLFTLTRSGRVETANYRTANIPSNVDVPLYVQKQFGDFYKAMFATAVERAGGRTVFTEYAWDMNWCDPCAADPLSVAELRSLGVYWLADAPSPRRRPGGTVIAPPGGGAVDVFVTRLHLRYDAETFPEDLRLHETGDRSNFQGRYVTRHAFKGPMACPEAKRYLTDVAERYAREAKTLANLTGWSINDIRREMVRSGQDPDKLPTPQKFWKGLWKKDE